MTDTASPTAVSTSVPAAAPASSPTPGAAPRLRVRAFDAPFGAATIPRHWLGGNAFASALVNGVNLLFPEGERFFIRSVRHYLDQLDPELRAQAQLFFRQEGHHAHAHERFFATLREQGYDIDSFLRVYRYLEAHVFEKHAPKPLRLAITAAAEHFTAIMAEDLLRSAGTLNAHPTMLQLLLWHASEELEHKAVAFDVLRAVNPSYALRMQGLALGAALLGSFWLGATGWLLWQDVRRPAPAPASGEAQPEHFTMREHFQRMRLWRKAHGRKSVLREVFLRGIRDYIRRDFHPNQNDNGELARAYLEQANLRLA